MNAKAFVTAQQLHETREQHKECKQGPKPIQTLKLILQHFCLFLVILLMSFKYYTSNNIIAINRLSRLHFMSDPKTL